MCAQHDYSISKKKDCNEWAEVSGRVAITARVASLQLYCLFGAASMHAFIVELASFQRATIPPISPFSLPTLSLFPSAMTCLSL